MSVTNEELSVSGATTPTTANSNHAASSYTVLNVNNGGGGSSSSSSATNTPTSSSNVMTSSITSNSSGNGHQNSDDIVKSGYLKKLKGSKKYFVLRKETKDKPARLEYYANDKKFASGQRPRKSITLQACFNINQTECGKDKYAIALHTHNDCVRIVMNNEAEMKEWLRLMNSLCGDDEESENTITPLNAAKPYFEHVWMVTALNKGLGSGQGILGQYRLCLTSKELQLLKVKGEPGGRNGELKFPLTVIRNVSHFECFFHIEFGRSACTGAGKLSLKTDDNNIAQNMHLLILKLRARIHIIECGRKPAAGLVRIDFRLFSASKKVQMIHNNFIRAMENFPREEEIRREGWNGWNDSLTFPQEQQTRSPSFIGTPPRPVRPNPNDGSIRHRPGSLPAGSSDRRYSPSARSAAGMDDSMSCSYGNTMLQVGSADSTSSSSFSMDNENNNNSFSVGSVHGHGHSHSLDHSDYIETSVGGCDAISGYVDTNLQSPVSPYDSYMPMNPSGSILRTSGGGKLSVSHSRNSSLIEDHYGYVPMVPGTVNHSHSRSESGACSTAGSTTGLDDAYFDMDFNRKLDLSSDDVRRMSPSSESIQSGTPSSDCQLEKVSSYLQPDDFDDTIALRPVRAFSVGSRSDTSSTGKSNRFKRLGLQSVQESVRTKGSSSDSAQDAFRSRAMSVGSKQPGRKMVNSSATSFGLSSLAAGPNTSLFGSTRSALAAPLSSSWSGSTGRWPPQKIGGSMLPPPAPSGSNYPIINHSPNYPTISHGAQDSADSDLMELDFSHNKHSSRKRSLPGPSNLSSASSTGSGSAVKVSPCARTMLGGETPPIVETPDAPKSFFGASIAGNSIVNGSTKSYATSAPISIQKANKSTECGGFVDSANSILSRITGMDINKLKELDDDGAYLEMDFNRSKVVTANPSTLSEESEPTQKNASQDQKAASLSEDNSCLNYNSQISSSNNSKPVVIKANENVTAAKFNCSNNSSSHSICNEQPSLSRSLSSSSNISTVSNNSTSSSTSCISVKIQAKAPSVSPERSLQSALPLSSTSNTSSSLNNVLTTYASVNSLPPLATATTASTPLSRIEESPEKHQITAGKHSKHLSLRKLSPSVHCGFFSGKKKHSSKEDRDNNASVTYADIQPSLTPMRRNHSFPCEMSGSIKKQLLSSPTFNTISATSCGKQSQVNGVGSTATVLTQFPITEGGKDAVAYSQLEFGGTGDLKST